jgi:hypothetical protein
MSFGGGGIVTLAVSCLDRCPWFAAVPESVSESVSVVSVGVVSVGVASVGDLRADWGGR